MLHEVKPQCWNDTVSCVLRGIRTERLATGFIEKDTSPPVRP